MFRKMCIVKKCKNKILNGRSRDLFEFKSLKNSTIRTFKKNAVTFKN